MAKRKTKKSSKKRTKTSSKKSSSKKSALKKGIENVWEKVSPSFFSVLENHMHNVVEWVTKISNIRYHMRKFFLTYAFVVTGAIVFVLGLSNYLATMVDWSAGIMHMVVGAIVFLFALLISRA